MNSLHFVDAAAALTECFSGAVGTSSSSTADAHKNEGFLKSAWHKLTHQHENLPPEEPKANLEDKGQEEEPKKASGSG